MVDADRHHSIPMADGVIVLRSGGPRVITDSVHRATAAVMLVVAAVLIA